MMINQKSPYFLYHLGRLSEIVAVFSLSSPMTPCSLPGSIIQWDVWTRSPCTLELVHPVLWHRVDFSTLESTTLPSLLPLYFNDFFFLPGPSPFWRRQWHPTPVLLPGQSHGWRSLEGCSPWDRWGSDTTERFHFHFSLSCIGEGNGNPLQCSCLENPRDEEDRWAAVYGVTQSRTRLKWLSNSSNAFPRKS